MDSLVPFLTLLATLALANNDRVVDATFAHDLASPKKQPAAAEQQTPPDSGSSGGGTQSAIGMGSTAGGVDPNSLSSGGEGTEAQQGDNKGATDAGGGGAVPEQGESGTRHFAFANFPPPLPSPPPEGLQRGPPFSVQIPLLDPFRRALFGNGGAGLRPNSGGGRYGYGGR